MVAGETGVSSTLSCIVTFHSCCQLGYQKTSSVTAGAALTVLSSAHCCQYIMQYLVAETTDWELLHNKIQPPTSPRTRSLSSSFYDEPFSLIVYIFGGSLSHSFVNYIRPPNIVCLSIFSVIIIIIFQQLLIGEQSV